MIPLLLLPATVAIGVALAMAGPERLPGEPKGRNGLATDKRAAAPAVEPASRPALPAAARVQPGKTKARHALVLEKKKKAAAKKAALAKRAKQAVRKGKSNVAAIVREADPALRPRSPPDEPLLNTPRNVLHDPSQPALVVAGAAAESTAADAAPASQAAAPGVANRPGFRPLAPFQLPAFAGPRGGPFRPVTEFLSYQYSIGSESDITYRKDRDLDKRLRDNSSIMAPQINGYILYRPNDRIETLVEMILERELPVHEEAQVTLPNGDVVPAPRHRNMLAVDQAWIKFKGVGPVDVTLGRRNFEDERHWLYDTSLDTVHGRAKWQDFIFEAALVRKDRFDGDLFGPVEKGRIDRAMFYGEYRGIEDIKLGGYAIKSRDRAGQEGQPWHLGLRAYGTPSDRFAFWSELALLRGKDELQRDFSAYAADVGLRYRYPALPLKPSITLGYASGSGDDDANDRRNRAFRQTGLQSNEVKGAGVSKFKYYGEALDPELSNLQILTVGLGLRLGYQVHVDLVYHNYRLNALADELRNAAVTAQMNQDAGNPSKDVGNALDLVVGLRNLFGERRLGIDLRVGLFRPGAAFRNEVGGDPLNPVFAGADKSIGALLKFWW